MANGDRTAPSLGKTIFDRRRELGLTQEQLAERIGDGVRQAEVSRLEHDRIGLPRQRRLFQLAAALQLSPGELLVRSGWTGADAAFSEQPEIEPGVADGPAHVAPHAPPAADTAFPARVAVAGGSDLELATATSSLSAALRRSAELVSQTRITMDRSRETMDRLGLPERSEAPR